MLSRFLLLFSHYFIYSSNRLKRQLKLIVISLTFWPESFNLGKKIIDVWQVSGLRSLFFNTIIVVIGAIFSSIIFNGLLAYGVSIVKPKGSRLVYGLILGKLHDSNRSFNYSLVCNDCKS